MWTWGVAEKSKETNTANAEYYKSFTEEEGRNFIIINCYPNSLSMSPSSRPTEAWVTFLEAHKPRHTAAAVGCHEASLSRIHPLQLYGDAPAMQLPRYQPRPIRCCRHEQPYGSRRVQDWLFGVMLVVACAATGVHFVLRLGAIWFALAPAASAQDKRQCAYRQ